jgi:hypothetical protein
MPYPGPMNWFPPHPHRENRCKNPNQLKRIQKRTQNFKSGEVDRRKEARALPDNPVIPNQVPIRLEESISNQLPPVSNFVDQKPSALSFLEVISKMVCDSTAQKEELEKEASASGNPFPRICVDRGVLHSKSSTDDTLQLSANIDFRPSSVIVTRCLSGNQRSVSLRDSSPHYGVKDPKVYANPSPLSFGGLKTSQIVKIAKITHYLLKKQRKLLSEQEELTRKTENIKISSVPSETVTMCISPNSSSNNSADTVIIPQRGNDTSEMKLTFHAGAVPSSYFVEEDGMEINDLSEFDP